MRERTTGDRPEPGAGRVAPAPGRRAALRVVVVYAAAGILWVLFSDTVVERFVPDAGDRAGLQLAKGLLFVVATAALLYLLISRFQARVAARDRQVRAVVDSMTDGVVVVDRELRIVGANAAAEALVGLPSRPGSVEELVRAVNIRRGDGRPFAPEERISVRALRGETIEGEEVLARTLDGREILASVSAAPVPGPGGVPELAVLVVRDMSEVRRFEGMREEFLATAAHELKTPLAVVKAYAQLMQRRSQGDPAALAAITRQADRLTRIVQQLLEVSRFRVGGGELHRERFDLGQVAEEVAARLQASAAGRIVVAREPGARVEADRERIAQVVANLLENALRFSPGGGTVETSVSRRDGSAILSVRDRGLGIPVERQDRVFERYYRAHAGTPQDYGGLGLGLDVSREIVARHGGRIWFESAPGQGSTFSFSLPLAAEPRA